MNFPLNLRNNMAIPEAAKAWAVPAVEGSGLSSLGKLVTPFAVGAGTNAYGATKDVFEGYRGFRLSIAVGICSTVSANHSLGAIVDVGGIPNGSGSGTGTIAIGAVGIISNLSIN